MKLQQAILTQNTMMDTTMMIKPMKILTIGMTMITTIVQELEDSIDHIPILDTITSVS